MFVVVGLALAVLVIASGTAGAVKTVSSCQEINSTNAPSDGVVELGTDLTASGDCMEINASDVVFDGQGNVITGSGSGIGVEVNGTVAGGGATNVTVRSLKVEDFDEGIQYTSSGGDAGGTVTKVNVTSNFYGIFSLANLPVNVTNSSMVSNTASGAQGDFSRFEGNYFEDNKLYIISSGVDVIDNEFVGGTRGIDVETSSNRIEGNEITSAQTGIFMDADNNEVVNNNVSYNSGAGIKISAGTFGGDSNTVRKNEVVGNNRSGINVTGADGTVVDDNLVTDNNRDTDSSYAGILVQDSDNVELTDNRVHRNTFYGLSSVDTDGFVMQKNRVTENCGQQAGAVFSGSSNSTLIESNNVSNNTGRGLYYLADGSNVTVRNVTANDNGQTGLSVLGPSGLITDVEVNGNGLAGLVTGGTSVSGVEARNNTVYGVAFGEGDVTADNVTAVGNNQTGIYLTTDANSTVIRDSEVRRNGFGATGPLPTGTGVTAGNSDHTGVFAEVDDVVIRDTLVTDNDVDVRTTGNNTTFRNVDVGSANLSGEAEGVEINETVSPSPAPSNHTGVGAYFNVTNVTATAYFDATVAYSQADASGINESTLSFWRDEGGWTELGGTVDTASNGVSYNITEFGVIGVFGDRALFTQPLIPGFNGPPTNTRELDDTLYEDLNGDGDGTSVGQTVTVFGELIRGNDLGLTDDQARALDWNAGSPETEVTVADMVTLFGKQIRAE